MELWHERTRGSHWLAIPFLVLAFVAAACAPSADSGSNDASALASSELPKPTFTADGMLTRPESYRKWIYIGTPLTPNSLNPPEAPFPEFHNVYIHPADFAEWEASGTFPDGTVLVKELVTVGSEQAVSGNGYFMGEFIGLEATVKDAERFADEPGNWAYFSFGHEYPLAEAAAAFPAAACNSCHEASAADDFVFTQYYPLLRASKGVVRGPAEARAEPMSAGSEEYDALQDAMTGAVERALAANGPAGSPAADVPTGAEALYPWLTAREYESLAAHESSRHPSRGPHTKLGLPVRVYMNAVLDASLAAGNESHPAGSATVKEMFDEGGDLSGWAVMVKTQADSDGGNGWYWYELASTENVEPVASGNGVPLCFGCHATGDDFILTEHPLE